MKKEKREKKERIYEKRKEGKKKDKNIKKLINKKWRQFL